MPKRFKRIKLWLYTIPILIIFITACIAIYTPPASKVIVIGLDAACFEILDPLIDAGRLPNIQRLIDGGVSSKLETFEVSISPTVWTTISTGVTRKTHGIIGFKVPGTTGTPYTSESRRVPAMWNIISHLGKRVGIVGHWVTWPAEEVNGQMVSSFISYDPEEGKKLSYKGKLRKETDIPSQTYPPQLIDKLQPLIVTEHMVGKKDLDRFFGIENWDDPDFLIYHKADGSDGIMKETLGYVMPWVFAADKTHMRVFNFLRDEMGPHDLLYTYIQGTDVAAHRFWHFHDTEFLADAMEYWGYGLSLKDLYIECFGDTLNRYYEWTDKFIGGVIDEMGPRDTLIVLSDHGFGRHWREKGYETEPSLEGHTFSGSHSHYGVIIFYGANVKKGVRLKGPPPDLTDVLPTILALLKLPAAEWMHGGPIMDALTERFKATYRMQWVPEYGIEGQYKGEGKIKPPLTPEYERRMRALGYIT